MDSGKRRIITREDISKIFGLRSNIYTESIKYLESKSHTKKEKFQEKFIKWKEIFYDLHGESEALNKELYLKYCYFALILKLFIIIKLSIIQNLDYEDAYRDYKSNNLDIFHIFEFDNFYWCNLNKSVFERVYNFLESSTFARQDLFIDIYQEIFFTVTRHRIGEFYTPSSLVHKMVDDSYKFGVKVIDPACGSGNFLIEILIKILNSDESNDSKIHAVNNIYGFDVNPIAVITTQINILLIFLEYFDVGKETLPVAKIFRIDSLFPEQFEKNMIIGLSDLYKTFDLIIGNPPWMTYKDLNNKDYQTKVRELADKLKIKPSSQYITHIELATLFFYYTSLKFLKKGGSIFFVITKSVLNGDHCFKFRSFSLFNKNIEIWDFPNNYMFNVQHICLKAEYIGNNDIPVKDKYPITAKIYNGNLELERETSYSSINISEDGASVILPLKHLKILNKIMPSQYKTKFFQGATLVPRTLVFFKIEDKTDSSLLISSDRDIISRAKKKWVYHFLDREIEREFQYKTFLNKDLVPFLLKKSRNVFLPITNEFKFDFNYLEKFPKAHKFYNDMNEVYKRKKKITSDIATLFSNLNYWNKLTKQIDNKSYMVVYNASGSTLKAAVIDNRKNKIVVGSENYYYSTDSKSEAYYLSAILNSPILSKNIKLIKSSRHIHKRPFSFPIPPYDENNELHRALTKRGIKCESIAQDLFMKNPDINANKVRTLITYKLKAINEIVNQVIFES